MDFWMNMLDSEPMKIERVRDVIEKASNSKIKSRKKINFWTSLLFTSKSSAYRNRFLHRGIRLRKRSLYFILALICIFTRRFFNRSNPWHRSFTKFKFTFRTHRDYRSCDSINMFFTTSDCKQKILQSKNQKTAK